MATGWIDGLTWWHVYPLGFSGAEPESRHVHGVVHRLRHLITWLDYARDLGCRGIQVGPVFASQAHGYDTIDHLHVDHRLGDERDFESLVDACRERGLRLLLEGVFDHVGLAHPLFQVALAAGPHPTGAAAQAADWFRLHWPESGGPPEYATHPGHDDLVRLNHDSPAVVDYVVHVMDHWLARGADGWWLDSAAEVPAGFWRQVLPRVRERHPDAWFVGSTDGVDPVRLLADTGVDAVTADDLPVPLCESLNRRDYRILAAAVEPLARYAPTNPPVTYVGGHDVTRLASTLHDHDLLGHAIAALFSLPGTPSIYYGDEQAFRGVVEEGPHGLEAVRPMFPDFPSSLAPWGWPTYELHRSLAAMRSRNPWLTRAHPEVLQASERTLVLRATAPEGRRLTSLLSLDDEPVRFDVPMPDAVVEVQSPGAAQEGDPTLLPGRSWRILTHA